MAKRTILVILTGKESSKKSQFSSPLVNDSLLKFTVMFVNAIGYLAKVQLSQRLSKMQCSLFSI